MEHVNDDFEMRLKELYREMISKRKNIAESRDELYLDAAEFEERAANYRLASDLERLDAHGAKTILAIEKALKRLYAGEYSTCTTCLCEIHARRLEAIPWADKCISCAELEETGMTG